MQTSAASCLSVGHSLLWQPLLKWSESTSSRGESWGTLRVPLQGRNNTTNINDRRHQKKEITDHPLWWERLSHNNEYKSNRSQIIPLRLCFSSFLISAQTLYHFSMQTHNFTKSGHKKIRENSNWAVLLMQPLILFLWPTLRHSVAI